MGGRSIGGDAGEPMAFLTYRAGYSSGARARERYVMWAPVGAPPPDPETVLVEFWAERPALGRPLTGEAGELAEEGLRDALADRRPRL
jgi:hypothetical protein